MRSAHVLTFAGAIAATHATTTVHVVPQLLSADPIVTSNANASIDTIQNTVVSSSDAGSTPGWSISAACRDLALICESKAGAEITVSSTSCSCLLSPSNNITNAAAAANESSSRPAEVTAAGAIPQQVQSSMAGLLGFFIMCLVIL